MTRKKTEGFHFAPDIRPPMQVLRMGASSAASSFQPRVPVFEHPYMMVNSDRFGGFRLARETDHETDS